MKNSQASESPNNTNDDLLGEYNFDYCKALPNSFASQGKKAPLIVTLDADVAEVFKTSEAVNNALRALLSAIPKV
ncbi:MULTISPECIES: hypothetical protein [Nostoc]|uniref:Uncharacterized protein n=1 Tax=Nostoc paludosum FACHB-159 TaxID=2692908 RepID=A0ABR8KDB0_9NOSO|nr:MULTISPECIES: hypothetical protein [Nostoc]MBD2680383.1 hypothetical protein [Nostoc sp. FACHB-857]MBD2736771.1 hypothetical protein [Nostoc paludosum FACHB-159]